MTVPTLFGTKCSTVQLQWDPGLVSEQVLLLSIFLPRFMSESCMCTQTLLLQPEARGPDGEGRGLQDDGAAGDAVRVLQGCHRRRLAG